MYTFKQQKENREKWLEALRSGKYKQALSTLKNNEAAYCCLGIACEISGLGEWSGDEFGVSPNT